MKKELTLAQPVMRAGQPLEIIFLLKLFNERKVRPDFPIDMRFLLDNSGSMTEESGSGGRSKMDVLKRSVSDAVSVLREGKDCIMVVTFSSNYQTKTVIPIQKMPGIKKVKSEIGGISTLDNTHMSTGLGMVVNKDSPAKDSIRRVVLFTDGMVNDPSESSEKSDCTRIAKEANRLGVPLTVFATGVSYNPDFLQKLTELAGKGSSYLHVQQTGEVETLLREEIQALRETGARDISVTITASKGAKILDAVHLVPDQLVLGTNTDQVDDEMQVLDSRGQNYLLRMAVDPSPAGRLAVGTIGLSWEENGQKKEDVPIEIKLTNNPAEVSRVDDDVKKTFYTAAGVSATLKGNLSAARTLFTHGGVGEDSPVMKTLKELEKSKGDEDLKRTLHTKAKTIHTDKGK